MENQKSELGRLIAIVKGETKGLTEELRPRSWRNFWIRRVIRSTIHYSLEEQLNSVELIGSITMQSASNFLKQAYTPEVEEVFETKWHMPGSGDLPFETYSKKRCYNYEMVGEPLRSALHYCIELLASGYDADELKDEAALKINEQQILERNRAHRVFRLAMHRQISCIG